MSNMDPVIKALGAIKREITKIVNSVESRGDKEMVIEFGERTLQELRDEMQPKGSPDAGK